MSIRQVNEPSVRLQTHALRDREWSNLSGQARTIVPEQSGRGLPTKSDPE